MTLKKFLIGTSASFALAWFLVVIVPFIVMRNPEPVEFQEVVDEQTGVFVVKTSGRVVDGLLVYQSNGCALCHTQVIRPTYAGTEMWRSDWAGLEAHPERGDTRRESNVFDYQGLDYAPIGQTRTGPDLSNLAARLEQRFDGSRAQAEEWLYRHLYNPREFPELGWSVCPPMPFFFNEHEVRGAAVRPEALRFAGRPGVELVPTAEAQALVSYLLSMRHDQAVPASMDYSPPAAAAGGGS
jgi:cytochrome c oxidase cbb3-type subunit II